MESDLREVETIVTHSGMRLYLTDLHLLRARLYAARNPPLAREHLTQALAHETGYYRRDAEIAALERAVRTKPCAFSGFFIASGVSPQALWTWV